MLREQVLWPALAVRSAAATLVPLAASCTAMAGSIGVVAFCANAVSTCGSTCVTWTCQQRPDSSAATRVRNGESEVQIYSINIAYRVQKRDDSFS